MRARFRPLAFVLAVVACASAEMQTSPGFIASDFWPTDMTTNTGWMVNHDAFFTAFDQLVTDARARGLRLVPSLLWNTYLFPDIAQEPAGRLFVPGSMSRMLAERYISEVVTRYRDRDAILFWELGNEMNLLADIDATCDNCASPQSGMCGLWPSLGTPCRRTSADNFFSCNDCRAVSSPQQDLGQFTGAMAALVHAIDPGRSFSSGFGYLRGSAHHLAVSPCPSCDWTADSAQEYADLLTRLHPQGVDLISVHHYFGSDDDRFGSQDPMGIDLLARSNATALMLGKQLYVGEWGEVRTGTYTCGQSMQNCGGDAQLAATRRFLDQIVALQVPFSTIWAWEAYDPSCPGVPGCLTWNTGDSDLLGTMAAHQDAFVACRGRADGANCPIGHCTGERCAPVAQGGFNFDQAGAESSWIHWTNCTNCTPQTFVRQQNPDGTGYLSLTSHDLPCTAGCQYAGAYAASPAVTVPPGHAMVTFLARSSMPGALLRVIPFDAQNNELQHTVRTITTAGFQMYAIWAELPASATTIRLRLEQSNPNSTVDLDSVTIAWEP
jgi:hypothetical protein